jgi:hypothetical protein
VVTEGSLAGIMHDSYQNSLNEQNELTLAYLRASALLTKLLLKGSRYD